MDTQTTDTFLFHTYITLADRIRNRFAIGLIITLGATIILALVSLAVLLINEQAHREDLIQISTLQEKAERLGGVFIEEVLYTRGYLLTGDESFITYKTATRENFLANYSELKGLLRSDDELDTSLPALEKLAALHEEYDDVAGEMIGLQAAGQEKQVLELFDEQSVPLTSAILDTRTELQNEIRDNVVQANLAPVSTHLMVLIVSTSLFALAICLWIVYRRLVRSLSPLDYLERALVETGRTGGTKPVRLPESVSEEGSSIVQAYNALVNGLEESVSHRLKFMSDVTHQIRSPLFSILGYSALLTDSSRKSTRKEVADYCQIIIKQAQSISKMTENMALITQIEEGQLAVTRTPLNATSLLRTLIDEFGQESGRVIHFEDRLSPALISGDAMYLREVFANLIDNALKFSSQGSNATVSAQSNPQTNQARFSFQDTGIGISAADQPSLFKRFVRIRNDQTRHVPGSGLGLYITKHIIEAHGGSISIESRLGKGTTVTVTVPLVPEQGDFDS